MKRFDVVFNLIKNIKNPIGAEIGAMHGVTSLFLLENKKDLILYSVDPYLVFEQYYDNNKNAKQHNLNQQQFDKIYKDVKYKLQKFDDRSMFLKMSSLEASKIIEDNSLDFVFIDANHLYKYVKEDILTWVPKVKIGGIIFGHDYDKKAEHFISNVCKAVDELFDKSELNFGADHCWWVIKKWAGGKNLGG